MPTPRLEINLDKIYHNTHELVTRLSERGICVTGVTKAALGSAEIANTLLRAGVVSLGDSRIENIKTMRLAKGALLKNATMVLIRSPMLSQVKDVVNYADISLNTEIRVIKQLSIEACKQRREHRIILMVELGDLREGIMPEDVVATVHEIIDLPNISLEGIGTNLACRSGVAPDVNNMAALSKLSDLIEATFGLTLNTVSGGNSANIQWALNDNEIHSTHINNLRLGEAILLGCEPLQRQAIDGLHTDAFTLVAEVIESKPKPSKPTGQIEQSAFGQTSPFVDRGIVNQAILAIGIQDIDVDGLRPKLGIKILGASSDHLIVESSERELSVGDEVTFQLNYSALLRATTSPFVSTVFIST